MSNLFREIMLKNAPVLKNHSAFFGSEYQEFNKLSEKEPSEKAIAAFQWQHLEQFQTQAFKEQSKVDKLNEFLMFNGMFSQSQNDYDQMVYGRLNNVFAEIDNMIRKGYVSKSAKTKMEQDKLYADQIGFALQSLGNSLNALRNSANMTISSVYIDKLDKVISELPGVNIEQVLKTFYHLKGDILEEVGTEWFNQRIPLALKQSGVKAISIGSAQTRKGQLISDIIVVDFSAIESLLEHQQLIDFKLNNKHYSMSVKDFLHFVEKYNGTSNIVLTDEGYGVLQQITLIGVQAKSGQNQLPWNKGSKNTWVSIANPDLDGKMESPLDQYLRFLDHMNKLYAMQTEKWNGQKNMRKTSPSYTAMANYALATSLNKVLHLSKEYNQYVLTPNGFMPFVSRIMELYEKNSSDRQPIFSFGGKIALNSTEDILLTKRPVIMKFDK